MEESKLNRLIKSYWKCEMCHERNGSVRKVPYTKRDTKLCEKCEKYLDDKIRYTELREIWDKTDKHKARIGKLFWWAMFIYVELFMVIAPLCCEDGMSFVAKIIMFILTNIIIFIIIGIAGGLCCSV